MVKQLNAKLKENRLTQTKAISNEARFMGAKKQTELTEEQYFHPTLHDSIYEGPILHHFGQVVLAGYERPIENRSVKTQTYTL